MGLTLLLVGIGGGIGAITRAIVSQVAIGISKHIPLGIFLCNIIGSFLIGIIAAFLIKSELFNEEISTYVRSFFITGFLGGFTTFSSFSLDTLRLLQQGELFLALIYILITVLISLLATAIGFYLILQIYKM